MVNQHTEKRKGLAIDEGVNRSFARTTSIIYKI
jgi:hypothetical protein